MNGDDTVPEASPSARSVGELGGEGHIEEPLIAVPKDDEPIEEPLIQKPWWRGNTNLYMALGSFVIIWFVLQRGPWRFQFPINTLTAIHVIAACFFGVFCAVNVFYTPNHGPTYRFLHIWLGRATMLIGFISVFTGMVVLYTQGE